MTGSKQKFDPAVLNKPGKLIIWFDDFNEQDGEKETNAYRFLSNFYVGEKIKLPWALQNDVSQFEFATGEHAFQAFKAAKYEDFERIAHAPTPSKAKYLGRECQLRDDWEQIKYDVMAAVVRSKFQLHRKEGQLLLATGTALLVEGTFWKDRCWGVDLETAQTPGRNWLGTLLMARRSELMASDVYGIDFGSATHNLAYITD